VTTTDLNMTTSIDDLNEAEAIGTLLARLPQADAAELIELARTCPATGMRASATRLSTAIERLRGRLVDVVANEHRRARADQEAATRTPAAPETLTITDTKTGAGSADSRPDAGAETGSRDVGESAPGPALSTPKPARAPRKAHSQTRPKKPQADPPEPKSPHLDSTLRIEENALLVCRPYPPTEQEVAAVRELCEHFARTPAEWTELTQMLGVA
jgi:hypothetical protein